MHWIISDANRRIILWFFQVLNWVCMGYVPKFGWNLMQDTSEYLVPTYLIVWFRGKLQYMNIITFYTIKFNVNMVHNCYHGNRYYLLPWQQLLNIICIWCTLCKSMYFELEACMRDVNLWGSKEKVIYKSWQKFWPKKRYCCQVYKVSELKLLIWSAQYSLDLM